jgi:hypothetical protein
VNVVVHQVVDFSAAPDAYPVFFGAVASWFLARSNPVVIMDGRFAADALRGSPCINATAGSVNVNLLINYFVSMRVRVAGAPHPRPRGVGLVCGWRVQRHREAPPSRRPTP